MNFRRYYIPGSAVFITQVVEGRKPAFANPEFLELLKQTFRNVKLLYPFTTLAHVFLPDHFHLILQQTNDINFSQIMHSLKPNFTKAYKSIVGIPAQKTTKFWQGRFWDHVIRDDKDLENHLHYIHFNPVKHGYVDNPGKWDHSSFRGWVKRGLYPHGIKWDEPENHEWGE